MQLPTVTTLMRCMIRRAFITKYIWSQDHKVIAIQYAITAIAIGLVALMLSVLMRLQLGFPHSFSLIAPQNYYQFITMHGMIMVIYLLTALFLGGFGNYLIPLMCGARDMVFPYLNMLSYWVYLLAVLVLVAGFFVPGGPTGAGWTLYPPQAILLRHARRELGHRLHARLARHLHRGVHDGRPELRDDRAAGALPRHDHDAHAAVGVGHFHGDHPRPAGLSGLVRLRHHDDPGPPCSAPASSCRRCLRWGRPMVYNGGSPLLFQHLFWFFGHPEVYIVALPAFGIVSDLLSTHARRHIFGYRMMVWAILAIGCLSFVVWAHHMYVSGMNPYFGFFFATTTLIIAVPTAIKVYNWVLTLWRGDIHLTVPMLFAIGFIFTFINGGLTGLFLGNVTVDVPLSATYFVVAHFHMVMGVSPILVVFGALYHWYPKITGRMLDDTLGRIHFWITFLGTYTIYLPMHYLGILGVPRRYYAWDEPSSSFRRRFIRMNKWITISALFVAAVQLVFLFNLVWSFFKGKPAGGNPWRATTLEWQTPDTPPKHGNWGERLPVVYRWAYDYSVPGAKEDFIPQNVPPDKLAPIAHTH